MSTCPLLRASIDNSPRGAAAQRPDGIDHTSGERFETRRTDTRVALAILRGLAGLFGWRGIQQVLDAIPESNEDFGYF